MPFKHTPKSLVGFGAHWRRRRVCLNKLKFNCGYVTLVWNLVHVLCEHMIRSGYVVYNRGESACLLLFKPPRKNERQTARKQNLKESGSERKKANPDINGPAVGVIFISVFVFHCKWMADATRWPFNNSKAPTTNSTRTCKNTHSPVHIYLCDTVLL